MTSIVTPNSHLLSIMQENKLDINYIGTIKPYNIPSWILKINIDTSLSKYAKSSAILAIYKQKLN